MDSMFGVLLKVFIIVSTDSCKGFCFDSSISYVKTKREFTVYFDKSVMKVDISKMQKLRDHKGGDP